MEEWVEVKAASVEDAVQAGMAELGIRNRDHVDVEILKEPEKGFLGIGRQDAVVKIKPRPRPKRKRSRSRRGKGAQGGNGEGRGRQDGRSGSGGQPDGRGTSARGESRNNRGRDGRSGANRSDNRGREGGATQSEGSTRGRDVQRGDRDRSRRPAQRQPGKRETETAVDINEQAQVIEEFLKGLLESFGLEGTVDMRVEDDVIYADINGEQTEALIGPRSSILQAIHELAKTVVQRKTMAGTRLRLDIGGYGERRRQALAIYAGRLAEQVLEDDAEVQLEVMNPADRKAVHDAVSDIEGVRSFSEGEDPRRSVVLAPDQ